VDNSSQAQLDGRGRCCVRFFIAVRSAAIRDPFFPGSCYAADKTLIARNIVTNWVQSTESVAFFGKLSTGGSVPKTTFDRLKELLDLFRCPGDAGKRLEPKRKRQSAAAVFRGAGSECELALVTSRDTGRWILPKGWIEADEDGAAAAVRETWEEAGLIVEALPGGPAGHYRYLKQRARRRDAVCDVEVYVLRLLEEKDQWPEKSQRRRKWFPVATAIGLIGEDGLKQVVREAFQTLNAA
jgi:8-oxo-dGTP pyrophosphatase MutT (NUDIX family)